MFKGIIFLLKYVWKFEKKYVLYSLMNQIVLGLIAAINLIFPKILIEQNRCAMACQGCGIAIFCFL